MDHLEIFGNPHGESRWDMGNPHMEKHIQWESLRRDWWVEHDLVMAGFFSSQAFLPQASGCWTRLKTAQLHAPDPGFDPGVSAWVESQA